MTWQGWVLAGAGVAVGFGLGYRFVCWQLAKAFR